MPACEVRCVSSDDIRREGAGLLAEYAEECAIPVLGEPNPQWGTYAQIEAAGKLATFGVYLASELVGFASVLMNELPHYGVKAALVESVFVASAHRASGAGAQLLAHIEANAAAAGCLAILYSAPAGSRFEEFLGHRYARTNSVFCRSLSSRP